jgi:membrane-anchored mycosin MYCP
VVVVAGPPGRSSGASPAPRAGASAGIAAPGLLRVGAINIDGAAGGQYQPATVDVVAPGVDVTSLGINGTGDFLGTGTQYAVAFAAGEAALVRSMYPNLTAAQVVRRIEATADRMGSTAPDATFGWGLINPGVAVTRAIADEGRGPDPAPAASSGGLSPLQITALVVVILLAVLMVLLLVLRIRRMVAPMAEPELGADAVTSSGATAPSSLPADMSGLGELRPPNQTLGYAPATSVGAAVGARGAGEVPAAAVGRRGEAQSGRRDEATGSGATATTTTTVDDAGQPGAQTSWWRHGPNGG